MDINLDKLQETVRDRKAGCAAVHEGDRSIRQLCGASQAALVVTHLASNVADLKDTGQSLGWEDSLEEGMAIHHSILNWSIPWTEKAGKLQSMGLQRVGHN